MNATKDGELFVVGEPVAMDDEIMVITPIGVAIAESMEQAEVQAMIRWQIICPCVIKWADAPPKVRLMAIDCDRQVPVEFNLNVGASL